MLGVVGMLVFTQYWYWLPLSHFLSLAFQPTAVIGLNSNLDIPVVKFKMDVDSEKKADKKDKMDVDNKKDLEKKEDKAEEEKKEPEPLFEMLVDIYENNLDYFFPLAENLHTS